MPFSICPYVSIVHVLYYSFNVKEDHFAHKLQENLYNYSKWWVSIICNLANLPVFTSGCNRSAIEKLGEDIFEKAYKFLKAARRRHASEDEIKEYLEKVVSRASDCFEVDQLVYFEDQLQVSEDTIVWNICQNWTHRGYVESVNMSLIRWTQEPCHIIKGWIIAQRH